MDHLFSLNAEGGPLLLIAMSAAKHWRGSDENSTDYEQLCAMFDERPDLQGIVYSVGGVSGIAWEMAGAGVADVFLDKEGKIVVVRAWMDDDNSDVLRSIAEAKLTNQLPIGRLETNNDKLAIMWAAESGKMFPEVTYSQFERVDGGAAIDGSTYAIQTTTSAFDCYHDEIDLGVAHARRLTLVPVRTGGLRDSAAALG